MRKTLFSILSIFWFYSLSEVFATEIPVLLWTNKGGLHYPVSLSGHTLGSSDFSNGYLDQIAEDRNQNVAVFLQDELSLEDLTVHGDVYNDDPDNAVFSSVKAIFETYESTHLPSVKGPTEMLSQFQKQFKGKVHLVESGDAINKISLEKDAANMIVVNLPKGVGLEKRNVLKQSDGIIGELTKRLEAEERPFSALYTAHRPSMGQVEEDLSFKGRHLLAEEAIASNNFTYSLFKIGECVLLYFKEMSFAVSVHGGERVLSTDQTTFTFPLTNDSTTDLIKDVTCANKSTSAQFTLDYTDHLPANMTQFSMTMRLYTSRGYWMIGAWNVSYAGTVVIGGSEVQMNGTDVRMDTNKDLIYGTLPYSNPSSAGYSYYCGNQPPIKQHERNTDNDKGKDQVQFTFQDIQLQLMTKNFTFGPPNHCTSFFTGAIWASLVVILLMTMILAFAVMMVMNITTMDRFATPRARPSR